MEKFKSFRVLMLTLVVLVLSIAPMLVIVLKKDLAKERFYGSNSDLQGVLLVWNIDTFEGGNASKSWFLEQAARSFEKQNKGLFVLIENLSFEEAYASLEEGKRPDLFSFGTGAGHMLLEYLTSISPEEDILPGFLESGMKGEEVMALSWAAGGYFLFASPERLESAGLDYENVNLMDIVFSAGFTRTVGKKTKEVKSLTFGVSEFCSPKAALLQHMQIDTNAVYEKSESQTFYESYVSFINGHASILLGNQRDFARLENKVSNGSLAGLVSHPLTKYTDMVQYVGVSNLLEGERAAAALTFANFLTGSVVQQKLAELGMFSVTGEKVYDDAARKMFEDSLANILVAPAF